MKAVCILICVAFAHNAVGNIFGRSYLPQMDLVVQSNDYIDQQQKTQQQQWEQQMGHKQKQGKKQQPEQHKYHSAQYVHSDDSASHEDIAYINKHVSQYTSDWKYNPNRAVPTFGDAITWKDVKIARGPNSPVTDKKEIEAIFQDAYETMKQITPEEQNKILEAYQVAAQDPQIAEEAQMNATQLLQKYGYDVEQHTIKTDDGYFLTLQHITGKRVVREVTRPVVFLMHGLLGSADDWLVMGPKKSLAYMLADAGYDVWLGNARGNKYSRRHVSKHPAQPDFWQFSIDEIALHDLPAMIDFALRTSNQQKMFYVGHSLGTTAFFALASVRPEYNDKIIAMYALSPMVYQSAVRSPLLRMIAPTSAFSELLQQQLGDGEFLPSAEMIRTVGGDMLARQIGDNAVSASARQVMAGAGGAAAARGSTAAAARGAAGSVRTVLQFAQAAAARALARFDYGARVNRLVYGSSAAPQYDVSRVRVPVSLFYGAGDWLAAPQDVQRLAAALPAVADLYQVPEPTYSHTDFLFNERAPELLYQRLIDSIQKNDH